MDASEYRAAFSDALVREIKAEMARQRVDSNRALAELAGVSRSSVNDRLSGATRTGRRTAISVPDLLTYAAALQVDPVELWGRAVALVESESGEGGRRGNSG
jgi:hypothetical protein